VVFTEEYPLFRKLVAASVLPIAYALSAVRHARAELGLVPCGSLFHQCPADLDGPLPSPK
jgi:hypothetical protein